MPLDIQTRIEIRDYLMTELQRFVTEGKVSASMMETKPLHARLLPVLFDVTHSERSFSTRSGGWWQNIAQMIGKQFHKESQLAFRIEGHIKPAASSHIDEIISQLDKPKAGRKANRKTDIAEVQTVQSKGGEPATALADLYLLTHDNQEMFFEMKTPQPNKDTCKAMKRGILRISAMRKGMAAEAYASSAYNPYGDGTPYIWNYAKQFLEIGQDMLIGRDFWEKIGDHSTYDELLVICSDVGKEITTLIAGRISSEL